MGISGNVYSPQDTKPASEVKTSWKNKWVPLKANKKLPWVFLTFFYILIS